MRSTLKAVLVVFLFCLGFPTIASAQQHEEDVSPCDLAQKPKAYNRKLVRVRGTLTVEFEDFSLGLGNCHTEQEIWLAFGGDVPGIVPSTVNDTIRTPGKNIRADGISVGIEKDDDLRRLYALITSRHGDKAEYRVTATLTGIFFAGRPTKFADGTSAYVGYGHLGCCSLLVISRVSNVDSAPPAKLSVGGVVVGPDKRPLGDITVIDDIVGGSPPLRQTMVTDAQGQFAFPISGRQLRIENPDYRPLALTVEPGGRTVRVTLENAKESNWVLAGCGSTNSGGTIGFTVRYKLPKSMVSRRFDDDGQKSLFVYPRGGKAVRAKLIVSRKPHGTIDDAQSLDTEEIEERWVKDANGNVIGIDARGRSSYHGEYFRSLNFSDGDVAGYSGLQAGKQLDNANRLIDSACIGGATTLH